MISATCKSGITPSLLFMLTVIVVGAVWLASGFCAATIAEMREGRRFLHFGLGLLFPWIYPAALNFFMKDPYSHTNPVPKKASAERKPEPVPAPPPAPAKKPVQGDTEKLRPLPDPVPMELPELDRDSDNCDTIKFASPLKTRETAVVAVQEEEVPKAMSQQYFASITSDASGDPLGPFMLETSDGRFLEAIRIINALPEVVVLEMAGEGGKTQNIRLPYSKITDCKLKSDWLGQ